ncbi:MAG TPA: HAD family hydrolase, partial [Candidatus Nitrosotenuis sp.]|nr:HAD family hydrolase [Candidatus Nitrosotenuis sp.]
MLPAPRAVLFDMGGTLLAELSYEPRQGLARLVGAGRLEEAAEMMAWLWDSRVREARDRLLLEFPFANILSILARHFHLDACIDELERQFWSAALSTRPEPGVLEALRHLERAGIATGVVSNSMFRTGTVTWALESSGLKPPLGPVLTSSDIGFRKPHPILLRTAALACEVAPREAWFVGDNLDIDVAGAR